MINIAYEAANEVGLGDNVNEGTLAMLGGPTFETPAELRMLKVCGVDAVGKNERISYKCTSPRKQLLFYLHINLSSVTFPGMSVVHEAITAHHCDIKVLAFSLITNLCKMERERSTRMNKINNNNLATITNGNSNHETKTVDLELEVLDAAESRKEHLKRFMTKIVAKIDETKDLKFMQKNI